MSLPKDPYNEAHLFVAAVRVVAYQKATTPDIEDICSMLSCSKELALQIARNLEKTNIVDVVETPYSTKVSVAEHQKIEEISKKETEGGIEEELKKFQESKKGLSKEFETIQAEQAKKKQDEFADIEQKLKNALKESNK